MLLTNMWTRFDSETCSESWLGLRGTGGVDTKQPDDVSTGGGDGSGDGQRSDPDHHGFSNLQCSNQEMVSL